VQRPWRDGGAGAGADDDARDADADVAVAAAAVAWPNFVIFANLSCLALWDFEQESHKMLSLVFAAKLFCRICCGKGKGFGLGLPASTNCQFTLARSGFSGINDCVGAEFKDGNSLRREVLDKL